MQGNHKFISLLHNGSQAGIDALLLRYLFKLSCLALPFVRAKILETASEAVIGQGPTRQ